MYNDEEKGLTNETPPPEKTNTLKCCSGGSTDRRLLVFISTLTISLLTILFSIYQLVNLNDCHSQNTYIGILTLILGIWIRSPI
jgi:hypothetical protein